jgi:hypothetical protein
MKYFIVGLYLGVNTPLQLIFLLPSNTQIFTFHNLFVVISANFASISRSTYIFLFIFTLFPFSFKFHIPYHIYSPNTDISSNPQISLSTNLILRQDEIN